MFSRSLKLYALAIPPLACCAAAGCSSNISTSSSSGQDAGVVLNGDSGVVQNTPPAGCPGPGPVTDVQPPVGRMLVSGNSLSVRGTTSDGYEIFSDDYAFQLYAVPISGGDPQSIGALGSNFWVTVVGQVVFAWSNVSGANVGALTIWSSAHGAQNLAPSSFGILGASSADGSQVLYVANVDNQGQTGDVMLSGTDGSGPTTLLHGQQLTGCFPQLGFAGSSAVASHCDVPRGDGPSSTISSFQPPGWGRTDLAQNAQNQWSADTAGTFVFVSTQDGAIVVPIGGGPTTMIDPSGFLGTLVSGGDAAVYGTTSGDLRRSSTKSPSPTTLTSPFAGFYGISPSQSSVLYYQNQSSSGTGTDVYLASAVTPGAPLTLVSSTDGAVNGDPFTADSAFALFSNGNDVCSGAATFSAFPVGGGSAVALGTNVWGDWYATGAKVVFNSNYVATGGLRFGRADIQSVDLSAGGTPTLVVSQADAVVDMTPARDQIIYAWSVQPGDMAGIYVTPVP